MGAVGFYTTFKNLHVLQITAMILHVKIVLDFHVNYLHFLNLLLHSFRMQGSRIQIKLNVNIEVDDEHSSTFMCSGQGQG